MKPQKLSEGGLAQLMSLEGCKLQAYRDSAGILTIGYGHTSAAGQPQVVAGMRINQAQAEQILRSDVAHYEALVNQLVEVPLSLCQFATLVMFAYNVGASNFRKSTLLRKLNQGRYEEVPLELMKWVRSGGKICPGLVHRRSREAAWWHKSTYISRDYKRPVTVAPGAFGQSYGLGLRALAPLTGIVAALANMVASSPLLQLAIAFGVLIGAGSGLYYYYKYHRICAL